MHACPGDRLRTSRHVRRGYTKHIHQDIQDIANPDTQTFIGICPTCTHTTIRITVTLSGTLGRAKDARTEEHVDAREGDGEHRRGLGVQRLQQLRAAVTRPACKILCDGKE